MIDLHNHLLPGVDDGAASFRVALHMLEIAVVQGITHVACTSHSNDRMTPDKDRLYRSVFLQLKEAAAEAKLPVELGLGSEIMVGSDLLKVLSTYETATYHGAGKYALIEFPTEIPFEIMRNVVLAVRRKGIWPVIAHYERFARGQRTPEQPEELRMLGAVLTLDAGSLTGQFGSVILKRAKQLMAWDCIDVLASDAHDDDEHGFRMKEGYLAATALADEDAAKTMVDENPRRIWAGDPWPEYSKPL